VLGIAGRTYYERGKPVVVVVQWRGPGVRNVLIRRANGDLVVRPFRGLRLAPAQCAGGVREAPIVERSEQEPSEAQRSTATRKENLPPPS
jgi:hypothetical protein